MVRKFIGIDIYNRLIECDYHISYNRYDILENDNLRIDEDFGKFNIYDKIVTLDDIKERCMDILKTKEYWYRYFDDDIPKSLIDCIFNDDVINKEYEIVGWKDIIDNKMEYISDGIYANYYGGSYNFNYYIEYGDMELIELFKSIKNEYNNEWIDNKRLVELYHKLDEYITMFNDKFILKKWMETMV